MATSCGTSCHHFESEESGDGETWGLNWFGAMESKRGSQPPNEDSKQPQKCRCSSARAMKCDTSFGNPLCVWVKAKRDGLRYYKNVCVCPEYPEWIRMVVRFEPCSSMLTHEFTCIIHNPQISSFTTSHQSTLMLIALFPPTLTYFICTAQAAAWIKSYLVTSSKIWGICWEH